MLIRMQPSLHTEHFETYPTETFAKNIHLYTTVTDSTINNTHARTHTIFFQNIFKSHYLWLFRETNTYHITTSHNSCIHVFKSNAKEIKSRG